MMQIEKETWMAAFKNSFKPEVLASVEVGWVVEPNNLLGDDFSIDDLLIEPEQQGFKEEEDEEEEEEEEVEVEAKSLEEEKLNSSSSPSSALSLDPPPPTEIIFPVEVVAELEWVSRFVEDSFMEFPAEAENPVPHGSKPHANSSKEPLSMEVQFPVKARSQRPRTVSGLWWKSTSSSSSNSPSSSSSSTSFLVYDYTTGSRNPDIFLFREENQLPSLPTKKPKQKKRGRKPKPPAPAAESFGVGERRCSHCGVQKTPQWRVGPTGAKTLCNACGVRFKSGRLLPEYRPASSPTFMNHLHSNSHRKVLEMRRMKETVVLSF